MAMKADMPVELLFGRIIGERPEAAKSGRFRISLTGGCSGRAVKGEIRAHLVRRRAIELDTDKLHKMTAEIAKPHGSRIKELANAAQSMPYGYSPAVVDQNAGRCQTVEGSGRMIDGILADSLLPDISSEFLRRMMTNMWVTLGALDVKDGEVIYGFDLVTVNLTTKLY